MRGAKTALLALLAAGASAAGENDPGTWGAVRVVEELRIGGAEVAEEALFGRVGLLAVDTDGDIFVYDSQLVSLRMFDASGHFVRALGGKGEGPGEFLMINGMTVVPNGDLAVYDARSQRITMFGAGGAYARDFQVENALFASDMLYHDMERNLYLKASARGAPRARAGPLDLELLKLSVTGEVLGRVPLPASDDAADGISLITSEGSQTSFQHQVLWAWSPMGYLVVGDNAEYAITLQTPEGARVRIQRSFVPVSVKPEERDEWRAWADYFDAAERRSGRPARERRIPGVKPPFKNLAVGDDGTIWVQRYVEAEKRDVPPRPSGDPRPLFSWRERQVFDVFSPEGAFLGSVRLPRDTRILAQRGRRVWGVYTDDEGESIVRLRIESAAAGEVSSPTRRSLR